LFAAAGSVVVGVAEAEPPVMAPGAWAAVRAIGSVTDVEAPRARSPLTTQVTAPDASVQPAGDVPTVTPAGGV
jgi:hypothetical protein